MSERINAKTETAQRDVRPVPNAHVATPPGLGMVAEMLALQQTAGNRAVSDLVHDVPLAPVYDNAEREAHHASIEAVSAAAPSAAAALTALTAPLTPSAAGEVQLHTDAPAARMAEQLQANAFTVGSHIYFGEGKYNSSYEGQRLVAHEMAHVAQQRGTGGAAIQRDTPQSKKTGEQDYVEEAVHFMQSAAEYYRTLNAIAKVPTPVTPGPAKGKKPAPVRTLSEADVDRVLDGWLKTLQSSEKLFNESLKGQTQLQEDLKSAYTNAVEAVIGAAAQKLGKTTHELRQAKRDKIHEWGWLKAVPEATANQQSDAIPEAERKKIQVISTTEIATDKLNVKPLFTTEGGTTNLPLPEGATVSFSNVSADKNLQRGLQNVAGRLTKDMTPPPLKLNSTVSLALDLEPFGSDFALYRFTYWQHQPARGRAVKQILIERLGKLGMEGIKPSERTAAQKKFTDHKFSFKSGWKPEHKDSVYLAVAQLPDSLLTMIDGVKFARDTIAADDSTDPAKPKTGGNYAVLTHTITMFDAAFTESAVRFGAPGAAVLDKATFDVLHEIGHAIDQRRVQQGLAAGEQAKKDLQRQFGRFETRPGSGQFENIPGPDVREFNRLLNLVNNVTSRTESGHKWRATGGNNDELVQDPTARTDFKAAAARDGTSRATPYSEKSWEEFFAEAFALYTSDPNTLKRLRPHIFDFFDKNFSRTGAPPPTPTPARARGRR